MLDFHYVAESNSYIANQLGFTFIIKLQSDNTFSVICESEELNVTGIYTREDAEVIAEKLLKVLEHKYISKEVMHREWEKQVQDKFKDCFAFISTVSKDYYTLK